jgi:hypothetical protein
MIDLFQLLGPISGLHDQLVRDNGPFKLFALVERDDRDGEVDVLMAAPWISSKPSETRPIFDELKRQLTTEQVVKLARVVILKPDQSLTEAFHSAVAAAVRDRAWPSRLHNEVAEQQTHWLEFRDIVVDGLPFRRGFAVAYVPKDFRWTGTSLEEPRLVAA